MHVVSLLLLVLTFTLGLLLQVGKFNIIDKVLHSIILVQIGNFFYELIWMLFFATAGDDLNSFLLYSIVFSLLVLVCIYYNKKHKFSKINLYTCTLGGVFLLCFLLMYCSGWFVSMRQYDFGLGPDPHNLLWALSKLLGFLIPISTLKT